MRGSYVTSLEYSNPDEPSADQVLTPGNHLDIFTFLKSPVYFPGFTTSSQVKNVILSQKVCSLFW